MSENNRGDRWTVRKRPRPAARHRRAVIL